MSIEQLGFAQEDSRKLSEKEIKEWIVKKLELEKQKKSLLIRIEKDKQLAYLKSIVERWLININTVEHIIGWENLDNDETLEIFDKIDQIEDVANINLILPEYYRINKEEYINALNNTESRKVLLTKIENALKFIYTSTHSMQSPILWLFYNLMNNFNKNNKSLVVIQWNLIDIKRSLI